MPHAFPPPRGRIAAKLTTALLTLVALLVPAATAGAAGTVRLATTSLTVGEGDGEAVVTIVRDTARGTGQIRYAAWPGTARPQLDYRPVRGRLDFADGQTEVSFRVPIVDDANVEGRETVKLGIFGAHPQRLGEPRRATLTIVDNDAVGGERDDRNPLQLDPPPPGRNPLVGARFYRNSDNNLAGVVIRKIRRSRPQAAALLRTIAEQPEAKRFGGFNDKPGLAVARFLERAQADEPGTIPLLATYRLKHVRCGGYGDTRAEEKRYKRWYRKLARGIGNHRAVVFFEIDALITMRCLSQHGLRTRVRELRSAIRSLAALPHAVVYIDAGSGLAHSPVFIARQLRRVGVHKIQGFFTNATHQNWTKREIGYGRTLTRLLGGRPHHVVNTATNGRGPLVPHDRVRYGNSFRCNAPGRGLGPKPTWDVPARYRNLDGFFWIGNPGRSAGSCSRTPNPPPAGEFWVDYAVSLVRNADFRIR